MIEVSTEDQTTLFDEGVSDFGAIERLDEEIAALPEEEQRILIEVVSERVEYSRFIGPIPPPTVLAGYENALPGLADRIVVMAEQQSEHRRTIEKEVVRTHSRAEMLGVVFAGVIALVAIVGGIVLIALGKSAEGLAAIIAALVALVGVFIKGRSDSSKELRDKKKQSNNELGDGDEDDA